MSNKIQMCVVLILVYLVFSVGLIFGGTFVVGEPTATTGYLQVDSFDIDTTNDYNATVTDGAGAFNWDSVGKRALIDLDDNWGMNIKGNAPFVTNVMNFSCDFYYDIDFPYGAKFEIRLIQDPLNMYVVQINSYAPYGDFTLSKYVDGNSVADDSNSIPFYIENGISYNMKVEFSPVLTKVTCANNTLIINTNTDSINVNSVEIHAFQVDMYLDNITWEQLAIEDPNSFMDNTLVLQLVNVVDTKFNLTPFLNTNDPYGDINKDGICNDVDIQLWDNTWTSEQKMTHRQWCFQFEKAMKAKLGTPMSYLQLVRGTARYQGNGRPVLIYSLK